jgi:hypothetical protein
MYLWFGFQSEFMNLCFCTNLLAELLGLLDNIVINSVVSTVFVAYSGFGRAKQSIPRAGLAACRSLALAATARSD